MPSYRASFGKGFVIGAGAAAIWAVAQYYGRGGETESRLIDWDRATQIAIQVCGAAELPPDERARLQSDYEEMMAGIEGPISQYTGTVLPLGNTEVQVM